MSSGIGKYDLALGAIQRDASEPISWHGEETAVENLTIESCKLASLSVQVDAMHLATKVPGKGVLKGKLVNGFVDTGYSIASLANPLFKGVENESETGETTKEEKEPARIYVSKPYLGTYQLFTPNDFISFVGECLKAAGLPNKLAFTTTLFDGSRMTAAVRLAGADFKDAYGHEVTSYINFLNSMDGTYPLFVNNSEIRTVCNNTATANLNLGGASSRHKPEAMANFVANFPLTLAEAIAQHGNSMNDYLQMAEIEMNAEKALAFFYSLLTQGAGEKRLSTRSYNVSNDELMAQFSNAAKGTYGKSAADAYNAVTYVYSHDTSLESQAPGGSADNRKRLARELLLSATLDAQIERGRKLGAEYIARL